ncbi:NADPH:quinone oxidoreductase family protein [Quisquiliibacterium transsilvanicum]|jgi:NADPH2:quinone reductase|uniref:NADPH2:quinone reductase n=1 Tax=Quisquiliibacterium transsilvanicum TaxID=1549638 RepID=A0A7W8HFR0_9BURK|nr:NADPH:quinone oxidoreductase family protein [Quisquiliibacterium transsilvanicum]MBB5270413.1 NADPH2:quinone reductase [Quisquiliibacterium transsilvanicum]
MKAWVVREWCTPDQMSFEEVSLPEPGPGQVRVKVGAAALNFLDTLMIEGKYQVKPPFPFTPGVEIAGVVDAVGAGCKLEVGASVAANIGTGGYAEYAIAEEAKTALLPDGVDHAVAATMPIVYPTAHLCLRDAGRMKPGETVLILAAAGGVGLAAIQLAKAWGAGRVIAAAGGEEKLKMCAEYGADSLVDYRRRDWVDQVKAIAPKGVDIVIDMVGGDEAEQGVRTLAWRGRFIVVGFAGGTIPKIPANRLLLNAASAIGVFWGGLTQREPALAREVYADLFGMLGRGEIRPILTKRYTLADAPQAMKDLAARKTTGKVVLVP